MANNSQESQAMLNGVPLFMRPLAAKTQIKIKPNDPEYAGEVVPWQPRTIKIFGEDQETQPTVTHEMTHVFQDSRNPMVMVGALLDQLRRKISSSYDYGGVDGLLEAQRRGKTIADFGPEQQADMVMNYQQQTQDAIRKGDAAYLDKINAAYGPYLRQLSRLPARGESMTTMTQADLTPQAPGLPPATESGMLAPNPLLGGPERIMLPPNHPVRKSMPR